MFTGIVENHSEILDIYNLGDSVLRVSILKPNDYNDIKNGDSICLNGVCLTIVNYNNNDDKIEFDLGPETLQVTGWSRSNLKSKKVNLERSMKYGDRIHGHFLSGHVDEVGEVLSSHSLGEAWLLNVKVSDQAKNFVWQKGSIGLSGVSLTVNSFENNTVSVCLIPETLKLTNLSEFNPGDNINIEYDWMAKAFHNQIKNWNLDSINSIKGILK